MIGRVVLAALAAVALASGSAAAQLVEGKNYARIANPQPVETGKKIEVIEFFSYGCPHCAELEPYLDAVARQAAAGRRVPARAGDVPAALGAARQDLLHARRARRRGEALAGGVQGDPRHRHARCGTTRTFFDWAASKGLDRKKVEDVFNSFAINGKMNRAKQLAQEYNIQSVPTVIVDGKFVTSSDRVGTHAALPAAIDELIAKARAERPKS